MGPIFRGISGWRGEGLCCIHQGKSGVTKRVLLIDDEDDIREVAQLSLEIMAGWEVLAASSGKQGLQMAAVEQPDVILLDVMMPEMDGLTTLSLLQSDPHSQNIPVILLTAKARARQKHQFSDLGVMGVISKPFEATDLAKQVANVAGWDL